jgi:hypothetical protein
MKHLKIKMKEKKHRPERDRLCRAVALLVGDLRLQDSVVGLSADILTMERGGVETQALGDLRT